MGFESIPTQKPLANKLEVSKQEKEEEKVTGTRKELESAIYFDESQRGQLYEWGKKLSAAEKSGAGLEEIQKLKDDIEEFKKRQDEYSKHRNESYKKREEKLAVLPANIREEYKELNRRIREVNEKEEERREAYDPVKDERRGVYGMLDTNDPFGFGGFVKEMRELEKKRGEIEKEYNL